MKHFLPLLLTLLLLVSAVACGSDDASGRTDGKLEITTTIGQITDITQIVGGDHVNVNGLMGPGVDPHLFTARPSDISKLQSSDIIFYNGLFLESRMEEVLEQMTDDRVVVAVTKNLDRSGLLDSADYVGEADPHVWFEVPIWMESVKTVRDTLIEADPENTDDYNANAEAYLAELTNLHEYVLEQANRVPEEQRVLITAHDAFSYFGRTYGFEVLGLQGISTESEAGTGDVQELADYIADNEIRAIFVESSVSVRNIEAVQAAVRDRGFEVEIGGELFSDAMGDADSEAGTYIGMVRHNIDTIVPALLGE